MQKCLAKVIVCQFTENNTWGVIFGASPQKRESTDGGETDPGGASPPEAGKHRWRGDKSGRSVTPEAGKYRWRGDKSGRNVTPEAGKYRWRGDKSGRSVTPRSGKIWAPENTIDLRVRREHIPCDVWERKGFRQTAEGSRDGQYAVDLMPFFSSCILNQQDQGDIMLSGSEDHSQGKPDFRQS